jgi:hypothetical protein
MVLAEPHGAGRRRGGSRRSRRLRPVRRPGPGALRDRLDEVEPGTPVTVEPFTLTLKQAIALDELDGAVSPRTPGNHLMVVLVDAENRSATSLGTYLLTPVPRAKSFMNRNLVVLDDRLAPQTASVYDADSDVPVGQMSPGLTYRLALVWEFGGPVPADLPLGLAELTLRGTTIDPGELLWQDPEEAALVTLPVHDLTGRST